MACRVYRAVLLCDMDDGQLDTSTMVFTLGEATPIETSSHMEGGNAIVLTGTMPTQHWSWLKASFAPV